jgi:AraC-like DNA-binding protein
VSSKCPGTTLEESYLELAAELLTQAIESRKQIAKLEATRPSTRAELLLRVSRGREFLHAHADCGVTLEDVARAAGMSVFHFHRSFRRAFGITPARYVAERRFEQAKQLLKAGASITAAAMAAGFGSPSTFSSAFHRRFGATPSAFAVKFRKNSNAGTRAAG